MKELRQQAQCLRFSVSIPFLLVFSMMFSYVAVAAVVSMQQPGIGGGAVRIPVVLYGDGEEALAGLQFDFEFDPSRYALVEVATGAATADAGKEVIVSHPASGAGRVLITGFNDHALLDGHVATVVLRPLGTESAAHSLSMNQILASDPMGNPVNIGYEDLYAFPPAPPEASAQQETADASAPDEPDAIEAADGEIPERAVDTKAEDTGGEPAADDSEDALVFGTGVATGLQDGNERTENAGAKESHRPARPRVVGVPVESGRARATTERGYTFTRDAGAPNRPEERRAVYTPKRDNPTGSTPPRPSAPLTPVGGAQGTNGLPAPEDETFRLAFVDDVDPSFAPPGKAVDPRVKHVGEAVFPEFSPRLLGATVVFGLLLFSLLVGLRTLLLDRVMCRRWRRSR